MAQNLDALQKPINTAVGKRPDFAVMWGPEFEKDPFDVELQGEPCTQKELLEYVEFVDSLVDSTIDSVNLDSDDPGIPWYKNISKLSHEMMNIRHLQGHVGQLSELLMQRGIDIEWRGKAMSIAPVNA